MAADLTATPSTGLKVQACGDCHIQNFGGYATPERNIVFDINDFDETIPAPWEWDIKRLAVSAVLALREMSLSKGELLESARSLVQSYRLRMFEPAKMSALEVWYARTVPKDFLKTLSKKNSQKLGRRIQKEKYRNHEFLFPRLTNVTNGKRRIVDDPPLIYHPKGFENFEHKMDEFLKEYIDSLNPELRVLLSRYRPLDAALKVVGIGSVGTRCAIALLVGENGDPLFLQFKEARTSVLERWGGMKTSFPNEGQRVVVGQKLMQSASDMFLGWNTYKGRIDFYFRQLRDAKISVNLSTLTGQVLTVYLNICGRTLAQASRPLRRFCQDCRIHGEVYCIRKIDCKFCYLLC